MWASCENENVLLFGFRKLSYFLTLYQPLGYLKKKKKSIITKSITGTACLHILEIMVYLLDNGCFFFFLQDSDEAFHPPSQILRRTAPS